MTTLSQQTCSSGDELNEVLNEQTVLTYLRNNPTFFSHQAEWLSEVRIPHQSRGTVSLVDIQLERLRLRIAELEQQQATLLANATKSGELSVMFSNAQIQLLQCHNIYQVLTIVEALAEQLQLSACLRLFDTDDELLYLARHRFNDFYRSRLVQDRPYLGRLRRPEAELLFAHPPQLGSFIVLPLGRSAANGVLSFASADGGHFQPEMDTLFVEQLATTISHLIEHWQYTREVID
ncbi:DUF484 family protein [Photobacterium leiognathi]|uniref:DUF484 family protein n=1 Tax=Photobacterium leiognathi TaxID=553611 RepID=UPI002981FD58|nr:DUF484 family protein [Photobacterium leiognathi]